MPQTRRKSEPEIYVATTSFAGDVDGVPTVVNKGQRVRRGHQLLKVHGGYFAPADDQPEFDVEQATAGPGEKRGD